RGCRPRLVEHVRLDVFRLKPPQLDRPTAEAVTEEAADHGDVALNRALARAPLPSEMILVSFRTDCDRRTVRLVRTRWDHALGPKVLQEVMGRLSTMLPPALSPVHVCRNRRLIQRADDPVVLGHPCAEVGCQDTVSSTGQTRVPEISHPTDERVQPRPKKTRSEPPHSDPRFEQGIEHVPSFLGPIAGKEMEAGLCRVEEKEMAREWSFARHNPARGMKRVIPRAE